MKKPRVRRKKTKVKILPRGYAVGYKSDTVVKPTGNKGARGD